MRLFRPNSQTIPAAIYVLGTFFLGLTGGSAVSAQTSPSAVRVFTFRQAVTYALAHYPAIRASLQQVNAARAGVGAARSEYLPSLNAIYQESRATQNQVPGTWPPTAITPTVEGPVTAFSGQSYWGSQAAALFSWEPLDFGLRRSIVSQARSAQDQSTAGLAVTQLQVAAAVGNDFFSVVASQQAVAAAQANVDRWQVFNRSVHVLVDSTLRPGADASRADAQLAQARIQLLQAQQVENTALANLSAFLEVAEPEIRLDASRLQVLPVLDALPDVGPAANPVLEVQASAVRQAQARESALARTDYPRFFLEAEGLARGSGVPTGAGIIGNANGILPGRGDWVAGITITLPNLFDFKNLSAQKQIAKANELSQEAIREKTLRDLTVQVHAARAELTTARQVAQQTPIELAAARASETQSRARYEASLATIVEVSAAEGLLAQAEIDDAIARLNVWRALFALAYAQGNLQPFVDRVDGPNP